MRNHDLPSTKTNGWRSAPNVQPIVVVLSDMQMTRIFSTIAIAVSDERGLVMVMKVRIGDGDPLYNLGLALSISEAFETK